MSNRVRGADEAVGRIDAEREGVLGTDTLELKVSEACWPVERLTRVAAGPVDSRASIYIAGVRRCGSPTGRRSPPSELRVASAGCVPRR